MTQSNNFSSLETINTDTETSAPVESLKSETLFANKLLFYHATKKSWADEEDDEDFPPLNPISAPTVAPVFEPNVIPNSTSDAIPTTESTKSKTKISTPISPKKPPTAVTLQYGRNETRILKVVSKSVYERLLAAVSNVNTHNKVSKLIHHHNQQYKVDKSNDLMQTCWYDADKQLACYHLARISPGSGKPFLAHKVNKDSQCYFVLEPKTWRL